MTKETESSYDNDDNYTESGTLIASGGRSRSNTYYGSSSKGDDDYTEQALIESKREPKK